MEPLPPASGIFDRGRRGRKGRGRRSVNQSAVIPKSTSGAKRQIKVHQGFKLSAGSQDYQNYGGDGTARSQGWKGQEALFRRTMQFIDQYANEGLRTLLLA